MIWDAEDQIIQVPISWIDCSCTWFYQQKVYAPSHRPAHKRNGGIIPELRGPYVWTKNHLGRELTIHGAIPPIHDHLSRLLPTAGVQGV